MKTWVAEEELLASDINGNFSEVIGVYRKTFVAGENISVGNAVSLGTALACALTNGASRVSQVVTHDTTGDSFTTGSDTISIASVILGMAGNASGSTNCQVDIYANSAGKPTGSSLATKTVTIGANQFSAYDSAAPGFLTVTLDTPYACSASTIYWIVVTVTNSQVYLVMNTSGTGGAEYVTGVWNTTGNNAYPKNISVNHINTVSGRVYKSNATITSDKANNFIGFANETITAGNNIIINLDGIDSNQSSLTIGSTYYLQNTAGTIGVSAGTISKKVGMALSATSLLIKNDN